MKKLLCFITVLVLFFSTQLFAKDQTSTKNIPYGIINPDFIPIAYSVEEMFQYDVSYTGGVKVGEARIEVKPIGEDKFEVKVRVSTDGGMFRRIYPIEDKFNVIIEGPERLPVKMDSWQKEGRKYRSHKKYEYNQETGEFFYTRDEKEPRTYKVDGKTHNEFSSFLASRIMPFEKGKPFIVPTFADKKRVEVVVEVSDTEKLKETIFGSVDTIKVTPIMTFKGLYDKKGDTVIWYTNDECRIPVKVDSKLKLGSLTAKLVRYKNQNCELYPNVYKKSRKSIAKKKEENSNVTQK